MKGKETEKKLKERKLGIWEELIGTCIGIEAKGSEVAVVLCIRAAHVKIVLDRDSQEARKLERLANRLLGQGIGILRTDSPTRPIIVRKIKGETPKADLKW